MLQLVDLHQAGTIFLITRLAYVTRDKLIQICTNIFLKAVGFPPSDILEAFINILSIIAKCQFGRIIGLFNRSVMMFVMESIYPVINYSLVVLV